MDIAGEGDRVITTWDGPLHQGVTGLVCSSVAGLVHSALDGRFSRDGGDGSTGSG